MYCDPNQLELDLGLPPRDERRDRKLIPLPARREDRAATSHDPNIGSWGDTRLAGLEAEQPRAARTDALRRLPAWRRVRAYAARTCVLPEVFQLTERSAPTRKRDV
ncbi:MAG TPA: hypothetical protein VKA44_00185, partial [Gemmatimonadota bacterium]|nr:hypothetical protein [Gemmatimonadota bacterium]